MNAKPADDAVHPKGHASTADGAASGSPATATAQGGPNLTERLRLRKCDRLARRADFQAVYDGGKRANGKLLVVLGRPNGLAFSRLGLSIGRRYGNAVARNRFKRVCREAFRLTRWSSTRGYDWILMPNMPKKTPAKRAQPRLQPPSPSTRLVQLELVALMNQVVRKHALPAGSVT